MSFASVEWGPVSDRAKELVAGLLTSNPKERFVIPLAPQCVGVAHLKCAFRAWGAGRGAVHRLTAKQALRHPWVVAEGGQHVKAISSSLLGVWRMALWYDETSRGLTHSRRPWRLFASATANMHRFALAQKLKRLALNIVVHLLEDSALTELLVRCPARRLAWWACRQ